MLSVVALFVLTTGDLRQCLFMVIILINTGIGIVTEFSAKRELEKLSLLVQQKYCVTRLVDGESTEVTGLQAVEIQVGDIVTLAVGSQVPVDGEIVAGHAEFNESMLTGESHNIGKVVGDAVLSGTVVVVGECQVRAGTTSANSYAGELTVSAKEFKLASSDLRDGINHILKYISFGIVPVAALLVFTQIRDAGGFEAALETGSWRTAVLSTAAGIVGMIPEGLVLLTSINFAIAAIVLARQQVLITELNSVETLARVDELILDKTGTITDGTVEIIEIVSHRLPVSSTNYRALLELVTLPGGTVTSEAIKDYITSSVPELVANWATNDTKFEVTEHNSFDSAKKYSSIVVQEVEGTVHYKLGAPDVIVPDADVDQWVNAGQRVLAMMRNDQLELIIVCREHIRENAADIINYFQSSGVNVQIVSGDNEVTVRNIGAAVGVTKVVGRAKPETKLEIVRDLQSQGKVVAMTGDGVNDMLALKEADLGISMGNAAPASKAVSNLVLVDSDFGRLPAVVAQGRRVIANIERVASLFLVKTFYSIALALLTIVVQTNYPFNPIHLTAISGLFIGLPAFFLSLPPNNTPYRKGFLRRVLKFSFPFGIITACIVLASAILFPEYSPTLQLIVLAVLSTIVLAIKSRPLRSWRGLMLGLIIALAIGSFYIPFLYNFFELY
jgi:cation-transporting ATPase E